MRKFEDLDRQDRRILRELQREARIASTQLAERVGLSVSPCWRRVRRLERDGFIQRYAALLDEKRLGLHVTAFVHVSLEDHHPDTVNRFDELVEACEAVMECYAMSGQDDYLLKVVATSMEDYERFLSGQLLALKGVRTANTSFVLKKKKHTVALPVDAGPQAVRGA